MDGFFEYPLGDAGTVTASGAYEKVDLGDAYQGANPDAGATGLFGAEERLVRQGRLPLPRRPAAGLRPLREVALRLPQNVFDQIVDWYGVGANYYVWGQNLKLTAEWSKTDFDQEGVFTSVQGTSLTSRDFNTFVAQMQFIF